MHVNVPVLQATGDVCMSPDRFLERQSPPPVRLQMDILAYYLSCETSRTNPFHVVVKRVSFSPHRPYFFLRIEYYTLFLLKSPFTLLEYSKCSYSY